MKWFKHLSTARNDERLSKLEDKCGLEGYGFYFKLLEIVSEVMDSTDLHERTYSLSRWGRHTNITSKKWLFLAQCCSDVGLITLSRCSDDALTMPQRCSDDYIVKIPKLLKHRDNYTKNLQVTCKQEVEVEVEVEVEKNEKKQKSKPSAPAKADAKKEPLDTELQAACRKTWSAYGTAYFNRYGTEPIRNTLVNTMVKQFVQKIGFDESPYVAEFFVQHNDRFYVQKTHAVALMNKDAEGLRTQWATGNSMTSTRAGQIDKTQANFSVVGEAMKILEAQNNAKNT
jgi:hypothetical protein